MLHLGAVLPNLTFAADAHYHHLVDDRHRRRPDGLSRGRHRRADRPGLGVELDREKLEHYADLYRRLGSYAYDRDPGRPGWYSLVPNRDWADPTDDRIPTL